MTRRVRRNHSPTFKAKVALAAIHSKTARKLSRQTEPALSTLIGGRLKTITDGPLKTADVGLDQRSPVVASRLPPSHAAALDYICR